MYCTGCLSERRIKAKHAKATCFTFWNWNYQRGCVIFRASDIPPTKIKAKILSKQMAACSKESRFSRSFSFVVARSLKMTLLFFFFLSIVSSPKRNPMLAGNGLKAAPFRSVLTNNIKTNKNANSLWTTSPKVSVSTDWKFFIRITLSHICELSNDILKFDIWIDTRYPSSILRTQ